MKDRLNRWLESVFADSDVNRLLLVLAGGAVILWLFLQELAPILGAVLIAYVLDGGVSKLKAKFSLKHAPAVTIAVIGVIFVAAFAIYALPNFLFQLRELGTQLPQSITALERAIKEMNSYLPSELTFDKTVAVNKVEEMIAGGVQYLLNNTLQFAGNLFALFIYMVVLPLLLFFLLRDKEKILTYMRQFIPSSPIFKELWEQVDEQFGSYVRGKFLEAAIIGSLSWIVFLLFGMDYAFVLATLIGLSVFVPFVGAVAVTFPVILFAYLQFGWSAEFAWIVGLYTLIQIFDGQILVPLLFSEVVNIHPTAIFTAIIFFGNLWGVWGVFFAIPLASLIKCLISVIRTRYCRQLTVDGS